MTDETMDLDQIIRVLHELDGLLGLALHRGGEGPKNPLWRTDAEQARLQIGRAVRSLEESQVTGYWDDDDWIQETVQACKRSGMTEDDAEATAKDLASYLRKEAGRRRQRAKLGL